MVGCVLARGVSETALALSCVSYEGEGLDRRVLRQTKTAPKNVKILHDKNSSGAKTPMSFNPISVKAGSTKISFVFCFVQMANKLQTLLTLFWTVCRKYSVDGVCEM